MTNVIKMGASTVTDSLTPRRLRMTRNITRKAAKNNLYFWKDKGKKLKSASPQETKETVIVSI
jgi:cytoplasmic iron level regulating protein YaaA (DUF328/UPF0246 family)